MADVGRRGYGPETLWRACVAAFHLNLGSTNDLYRRLEEDAALAAFCGFGSGLPHRTTFVRFIQRLACILNMDVTDRFAPGLENRGSAGSSRPACSEPEQLNGPRSPN